MNHELLPFALPEIGEEEITEVVDTLRSGWVTSGPKMARFEEEFAAFLGGGVEAVALNSATAGLHLGLEAMGIGHGDEVITTTHTFTSTAQVIRFVGAKPVLVDIDPDTLCIDPSAVEASITPRTRAIIPVHFGGRAAEMDRLLALAARRGIKVLEDAAHALPSTSGGKLIGTLASEATSFSFYANKTITTGEGGMLVTARPEIAARARTMRLHGISRPAFDRYRSTAPSWHYEIVAPGQKYNMTDIAAAIGLHQLRKAREFQAKRARIAARYTESFAGLPLLPAPDTAPGEMHAWHLYAVRLTADAPVGRDTFIERMHREHGIGCSVHYIPLHQHPFWRDELDLTPAMFPHSEDAWRRIVSLPIYSRMTEADTERVIAAVRSILC